MKSLISQIEFIDKKLLPLFGISNLLDYKTTLCISNPDALTIDLNKFNELLTEFREKFHAKNFSLHKTDYKIISNGQAICTLKTCLEVTSIPFDISVKNKQKYLRLISKNNILEDYINTLKMSENRTFDNESEKQEVKNSKTTNNITENEYNYSVKSLNNNQYLYTKDDLQDGVKTTHRYEFIVEPRRLLFNLEKIIGGKKCIKFNLKGYDLNNKNLSSIKIDFISKKFINESSENENILSNSFIKHMICNIHYRILGGGKEIYNSKFTNDNLIPSKIIIPLSCLCYNCVEIEFYELDEKIFINIIDNLEMLVKVEYVDFYSKFESTLVNAIIEQEVVKEDNLYNVLKIMSGMVGMKFKPYLTKEKYDIYLSKGEILPIKSTAKNNIFDNENIVGKRYFLNNTGFEGFFVENHQDDKSYYLVPLMYHYDFSQIDDTMVITKENYSYWKTTSKNKIYYNYQFSLQQPEHSFDSISKLQIVLEDMDLLLDESKALAISLSNYSNKKKLNYKVREAGDKINVFTIDLDLEDKHICFNSYGIDVTLVFTCINESVPIKENIILLTKSFFWESKYRKYLRSKEEIILPIEKVEL